METKDDMVAGLVSSLGVKPPPQPPQEQFAYLAENPGVSAGCLLEEYEFYVDAMHDGFHMKEAGGFAVGELITPRLDTYIRDHGQPYIVLEALNADENWPPRWASDWCGTMRDGFMPNLRVGRWTPHGMLIAWVEAWAFEEYDGPVDMVA